MNAPSASAPASVQRKRLLGMLGLIFLLLAGFYGLRWFSHGRHHVSTDDAYVAGHLIRITPRIAGTVTAVHADNTDEVKKGQILVQLDDTDARLAMDKAEAELASTVRQIRQRFETYRQQQAQLSARQNALEQAAADLQRRELAVREEAVSKEEAEHARATHTQAQAALNLARAQLAAAGADIANTTIATHPAVRQAAARVRAAWLDVQRCALYAPETGQIEKRSVQVGQQIAPGAPLMTLVPMHRLWVEANYKEDQLKGMQVGQRVELISDLYGDDVVYHGQITGLSPGTGSVFSLLPAQNASGNWIKIIQRLPVRIALDPAELAKHPLRVGLSMQVEVDVSGHERAAGASRQAAAPAAAETATPATPVPGTSPAPSPEEFKVIDARIRQIIQTNLSGTAGLPA